MVETSESKKMPSSVYTSKVRVEDRYNVVGFIRYVAGNPYTFSLLNFSPTVVLVRTEEFIRLLVVMVSLVSLQSRSEQRKFPCAPLTLHALTNFFLGSDQTKRER